MGRIVSSLGVFLLLGASQGWAAVNLTVRIEKSDYGFGAQHAVVFKSGSVAISRNSDTFCDSSSKPWLGIYREDEKPKWESIRLELEEIERRVAAGSRLNVDSRTVPGSDSAHSVRVFLGAQDLQHWPEYASRIVQIVESTCEGPKQLSAQVVRVSRSSKSSPQATVESTSEAVSLRGAQCRGDEFLLRCRVPRFGEVRLRTP